MQSSPIFLFYLETCHRLYSPVEFHRGVTSASGFLNNAYCFVIHNHEIIPLGYTNPPTTPEMDCDAPIIFHHNFFHVPNCHNLTSPIFCVIHFPVTIPPYGQGEILGDTSASHSSLLSRLNPYDRPGNFMALHEMDCVQHNAVYLGNVLLARSPLRHSTPLACEGFLRGPTWKGSPQFPP